jgi:hypothetical protein
MTHNQRQSVIARVDSNIFAFMEDTARYRESHDEEYNFKQCKICVARIKQCDEYCEDCFKAITLVNKAN